MRKGTFLGQYWYREKLHEISDRKDYCRHRAAVTDEVNDVKFCVCQCILQISNYEVKMMAPENLGVHFVIFALVRAGKYKYNWKLDFAKYNAHRLNVFKISDTFFSLVISAAEYKIHLSVIEDWFEVML